MTKIALYLSVDEFNQLKELTTLGYDGICVYKEDEDEITMAKYDKLLKKIFPEDYKQKTLKTKEKQKKIKVKLMSAKDILRI